MLDNALIDLVATTMEAAIASAGWTYFVVQKNQPTQEGIPSGATAFLERISDHRYGHPIFKEAYQAGPNNFAETSNQLIETTFQISALVPQDPSDLNIPTASDVAEYICQYMQTRTAIRQYRQAGVSVLRVTGVRTPFLVLDKDQFEGNPSFDIVFQHNRTVTMTVPAANKVVNDNQGVIVVL